MSHTAEKKKPHHGDNLVIARKWKKMTQYDVAEKVGLHQTEISTMEKQEVIDGDLLDRIAKAMDIPLNFFTDFDLEEAARNITTNNNNTLNDNAAETNNTAAEINEQTITYNYNPLDKVTDLYERMLAEKDIRIEKLERENRELKR